jgi:hypothetical protein
MPKPEPSARRSPPATLCERVAIVGLGGLFPGAATLADFWRNISQAIDTSREVPAQRWCIPPERAYDARLAIPDKVCSLRGYFLDPFQADLTGLDIDPDLLQDLDVPRRSVSFGFACRRTGFPQCSNGFDRSQSRRRHFGQHCLAH